MLNRLRQNWIESDRIDLKFEIDCGFDFSSPPLLFPVREFIVVVDFFDLCWQQLVGAAIFRSLSLTSF